ncbi:MAG: hypothetical protein R2737_12170 [Candidatus Nanopelagicales bacterium]
MGTPAVPPGWPPDLPPAETDEFGERVVGWLLDRCPPDYRLHDVLRANPRALARLTAHHVDATLEGARRAYAGVRRELRDRLTPEAVDAVLVALEREGTRLLVEQRQVALVEEALDGRRWVRRL